MKPADREPANDGRPSPVVRAIGRSECEAWGLVGGAFAHHSDRFFRVIGVRTGASDRVMLDQPEVGLLAFLVATGSGSRSFLVQWKAEPGNVGLTQAGPTVQATRSNMDRVHGGRATLMLSDVLDPSGRVADVLGSEQGDRFLTKFNRDVLRVLASPEEIAHVTDLEDHEWVERDCMAKMLLADFIVNTDARSVLAVAPWRLLAYEQNEPFLPLVEQFGAGSVPIERSRAIIDRQRCAAAERKLRAFDRGRPEAELVPLDQLRGHSVEEAGIFDASGAQVVGWFDVRLPGREVERWCQPLLMQPHITRCVVVLTVIDGCLMLGLRPSIEPGWTRAEFGPTLQTGHDDELLACVEEEGLLRTIATIQQSDEGGRFFQTVARYVIARLDDDPMRLGTDIAWLTLAETESLTRRTGTTTNELRSCLSLLLGFA